MLFHLQEDKNLYGAHPFYMVTENDGSSHGVFFLNSHATGKTCPQSKWTSITADNLNIVQMDMGRAMNEFIIT